MLYNENGIPEFADKGYTVSVGGSQPDRRSYELTGNKVTILEI
jgi:hypothetical protein